MKEIYIFWYTKERNIWGWIILFSTCVFDFENSFKREKEKKKKKKKGMIFFLI